MEVLILYYLTPKWVTQCKQRLISFYIPNRKVNHVVYLIPPNEASKRKAFQLNDEHVRQTPKKQLLRGLSVLLTFWTVPDRKNRIGCISSMQQTRAFLLESVSVLPGFLWGQHFRLGEEVEALLQAEVSCPGGFASRARVLVELQILGAHQHVFLQALVIFPYQLQSAVLRHLQRSVPYRKAWRLWFNWTTFVTVHLWIQFRILGSR